LENRKGRTVFDPMSENPTERGNLQQKKKERGGGCSDDNKSKEGGRNPYHVTEGGNLPKEVLNPVEKRREFH